MRDVVVRPRQSAAHLDDGVGIEVVQTASGELVIVGEIIGDEARAHVETRSL